jgi:NADH-quinone oxidoreductase subunit M
MYIRAVHNRLAEKARSFDLSLRDGLVLVPLVAVIVAFALYPQQALKQSEPAVTRVVQASSESTPVAQEGVTP